MINHVCIQCCLCRRLCAAEAPERLHREVLPAKFFGECCFSVACETLSSA